MVSECVAQGEPSPVAAPAANPSGGHSTSANEGKGPKVYKDSGWSPTPEKSKKTRAPVTEGKRIAPIIFVAAWFCLVALLRIVRDWRRRRIQMRHVAEMEEYFRRVKR
ncbi:MAG: hypothetical protein EBS01_05135 [Verrucomicrobia bacterium]|nr:hypothetical protein [Verrucomicrobiota bacterium]